MLNIDVGNENKTNILNVKRIIIRVGILRVFLYVFIFFSLSVLYNIIKFEVQIENKIKYKLGLVDVASIQPFVKRSNSGKVDWHNYNKAELKTKINSIYLYNTNIPNNSYEFKNKNVTYNIVEINGDLSDGLPLNRVIPDTRYELCKTMLYDEHLPSVSVIICFHNEHWSTLLRTLHSIFDRSPQHLLKELILVDDASNKGFLKNKLSGLPKMKLIHLDTYSGLIFARHVGAKNATGDILLFMDPHCEVNVNWLPPLLELIGNDHNKVVCPVIDIINATTFQYEVKDNGMRGVFDWELNYYRVPLPKNEENNLPQPFKTPVMAGMVFAISRYFFWKLGGYDEGLTTSGCENLELSFKIWQCGGSLYEVPCSRVGCVHKMTEPDSFDKWMNGRRIAEVWMDNYAQNIYNEHTHSTDLSDLSTDRKIRENLMCKPFQWYLTNVALEVTKVFPLYHVAEYARGQMENDFSYYCIDARHGSLLVLKQCNRTNDMQDFIYERNQIIRLHYGEVCFDRVNNSVVLNKCDHNSKSQVWYYDVQAMQVVQEQYCLDVDIDKVIVDICTAFSPTQKWHFSYVDCNLTKHLKRIYKNSIHNIDIDRQYNITF